MPCLWPSFSVQSSFLKKVSSIKPHFLSFILGKANAMQYVHFKSNHTKRFGHHLYILSLHFMWYLFGLIPGQRYAMCLADRIKSATPSIKGHEEVYLKRERGFFHEKILIKSVKNRTETNSVPFNCSNSTESKAMVLKNINVADLTYFFSELSTTTHTARRLRCLRFSQDDFGWIQTEDVIWESKWTHARLGVQQIVNQCSAVSVQAAAVWWVDGAAMQDCHWAAHVRWDDNMSKGDFKTLTFVCSRRPSMCVMCVSMVNRADRPSPRRRNARIWRRRIVTTRRPCVTL